ncbi:MAG: PQQ-binding-like beta-propeller repeat protein [Bacteroidetes bacterium]|nr:PQQ-binding-like beta-propeller repeat protein [Bacteroidota bacterium]
MRTILVFFVSFFACINLQSQQILNSADVKIKSPLKSVWEFKTNSTLLNQKITGGNCYINTLSGIQAISLTDGKQIWNYDFPKDKSISSVVTFSDKYGAYINYRKNSSSLILIDLSNGKEKWNIKSREIWHKPAAMLNDKFVICLNGPPKDWNDLIEYFDMKLDESRISAFKTEDGKLAWETMLEDNESDLLEVTNDYAFVSYDFSSSGPKNKIKCFTSKEGNLKWDYNPSGMSSKVMIGGVQIFNNDVYTFPQYGGSGQLARININSGDEKWNVSVFDQRSFIPSGKTIFNSSMVWQNINPGNGDKVFAKSLKKSSFSLGSLFSVMAGKLFGQSFIGAIIGLAAITGSHIAGLFPEGDDTAPEFIPTQYLFRGLQTEDVANNKGLFSVVKDDEEVKFISMNLKSDDDKKTEKKFPKSANDLSLSNGTNENSIFATSKGKVYSLKIPDGSVEWEKDFSNGVKETSLGLIINNDKMYLFTDGKISMLISE